jgi:hypothetical protein
MIVAHLSLSFPGGGSRTPLCLRKYAGEWRRLPLAVGKQQDMPWVSAGSNGKNGYLVVALANISSFLVFYILICRTPDPGVGIPPRISVINKNDSL